MHANSNMLSADPTELKMSRKLSVAPMMDWTDRHCRYFHRLLSPNALLYTEMVTTGAILQGDTERFLRFSPSEQPLALQLGGSNPEAMAKCAVLAQQAGYQEVNINVGCPSDRVQNGRIGACLMAEPQLVADCVSAMKEQVTIPVTVKTRIGIDQKDSEAFLFDFLDIVSGSGCDVFIIHARKAILKGLSPKENRVIPPLNYQRVYQAKQTFPDLTLVVNGGIKSTADIAKHWAQLDGVMIGREAYHNPFFLAEIETQLFQHSDVTRGQVLSDYLLYVDSQLTEGVALQSMSRHILGLFSGLPGGKHWRRYLSEHSRHKNAGVEVILAALEQVKRYSVIN